MTKYSIEQIVLQDIIARNMGTFLLELRTAHNLTQREVAIEASGLQSKISSAELGKYQQTISSIVTHIMAIGAARVRKEICNNECPCKLAARNHTAKECQDGTRYLSGQAEVGEEILRPGDGDLERVHL